MPNPPRKRKTISTGQLHASPLPMAEIKYSMAVMRSVSRPPSFCPTTPAPSAPTTVPTSAMATVQPLFHGLSP